MYSLLYLLPKNLISLILGWLANIPLPTPLAEFTTSLFAKAYKIDLTEAIEKRFECIGKLFVRDLHPSSRPIGAEPVSPVDGTLRYYGPIMDGKLEQIKGQLYSVRDFLGSSECAEKFDNGYYFNFYLSPPDYHQIHSPVSGEISKVIHIPGKLWPVNDWSINSIPNLFCVNERVVNMIETASGLAAVVMVGATNVGSIRLAFAPDFRSNRPFAYRTPKELKLSRIKITAGEKLGTFMLGSSVVVLFEKPPGKPSGLTIGSKVKVGVSL